MKLAFSIFESKIPLPADIQGVENITSKSHFGGNIISTGINVLLFGITITALFFMIFGGIKWITSEGDPKQLEGARNTMLYSAIGLAVAFLSFLIVNTLGKFLNFPLTANP